MRRRLLNSTRLKVLTSSINVVFENSISTKKAGTHNRTMVPVDSIKESPGCFAVYFKNSELKKIMKNKRKRCIKVCLKKKHKLYNYQRITRRKIFAKNVALSEKSKKCRTGVRD